MSEIKKLKVQGTTYDIDGGSDFDIHALTEENAIGDTDEMPFYGASASASRKTAWSNIKAKLKGYFDTLYIGASSLVGYATQLWVQQQGYGTYSKPSGGIPKTDLASDVQTSLGRADTALQSHQSLAGYATEAYVQSYHDATKQDVINDLASIRSGAALGATALQSVPNTYRTAAAQDEIDMHKVNKAQGVAHAGEFLVVGSDGNVTTRTLSAWQGGSY